MTPSPDIGAQFRALHDSLFVMPNPWDAGSARILQAMDFKALATTSAGMAFALGKRDGQVSQDEVIAHCQSLVAATILPVSADMEKGFGDSPKSAAETIRVAASLGLAGCSIEDHTKDVSHPIYDFGLAVERIAAAAEAARSLPHDFVLTARCENYLWGRVDFDDTLKRLQAFEKAGADVLFAPGLRDIGQIRETCAALSKPVNVVMGIKGVTLTVADLAEAGVKRISVGASLSRLAYGALVKGAQGMLDGSFAYGDEAIPTAKLEAMFPV